MKDRRPVAAIAMSLLLSFFTLSADKVLKVPRINPAPEIDGIFEEKVYKHFLKVTDFYQFQPKLNAPPTEKTEFYIGYDDENLYLAFKCYDKEPSKIRAFITRREQIENSDLVGIFIDPFNTGFRAFIFLFNPYGIQADGIHDDTITDGNQEDFSWDTLFYSKGKIYSWGYFVEAKIPFKSLRFPAGKDKQEWGFHIFRLIPRKGEIISWIPFDRSKRGMISQSGKLIIEDRISPGLHMEFIPVFTALKNQREKFQPELGFSYKYSLSSDLTLDLTYNPDFSHIEADVAQIDINQRYALYYEEKRPFFLEGQEIFKTPIQVFYSRRIAKPLFGAKLTGRYGRSTIGILSAYDTASFEDLWSITEGGEEKAWLNVLRYRYEIMKESYLGFFLSDKRWGNGFSNTVLGMDSYIKIQNFVASIQGLFSSTEKEGALRGQAYFADISYTTKHTWAGVGTRMISPDFDAQVGFIKRTDFKSYYTYTGARFYPGKKLFVEGGPGLFYQYITDWKGEKTDETYAFNFNFQTLRRSWVNFFIRKEYEKYKEKGFDKFNYGFSINSNMFKFLSFGTHFSVGDGIYYSENPYLGYQIRGSFWSTLFPSRRTSISSQISSYRFYKEKGGELVYEMNIYRIKAVYLFTRELSTRFIWQYNDFYRQHYLSFLLSYEYVPGTVFYLGFSSDFTAEGGNWKTSNYSIFVKFSYLFRI